MGTIQHTRSSTTPEGCFRRAINSCDHLDQFSTNAFANETDLLSRIMTNWKPDQAPHYDVFWVESAGMPINHVAIFVETHELGPNTGHIFQVSGSIQGGMYHNHRPGKKPEEDEQSAFISKRLFPGQKLIRCGEWAEDAIKMLRMDGVLA